MSIGTRHEEDSVLGITTTWCPDCEDYVAGDFVAHREQNHPPTTTTLAVSGIKSREAHGYQPTSEEE